LRRRFDHLWIELSVAIDATVPRYDFWLWLGERGLDPEHLSRDDVMALCDGPLHGYLRTRGWSLAPRRQRRLRRAVAAFDPRRPTPEERLEALLR
jgi:hypothetical protein